MAERTTDALEILERLFVKGHPETMGMLAEEGAKLEIAQAVYGLRQWTLLTQAQFAKHIGVAKSVLEELEEADYAGDAFGMLAHIAAVLGRELEIRIVTLTKEEPVGGHIAQREVDSAVHAGDERCLKDRQ